MDLRQLEHFLAVAETRHFTQAARRMNIVQSGLSASIRALEDELGAELFIRTTRRVELTTAGRTLHERAQAILAGVRDAREAVAAVQGLRRGVLTIGTAHSIGAFVDLPALLGRFHRAHRDIEIRLAQAGSSTLLEQVRENGVDLAFVPMFGRPPSGVASTLIACESLVVACAAEHPLAGRSELTLAAMADQPFVDFQSDWGTRRLVDRAFAKSHVERRVAFEVSDLTTMLDLVSLGLGIALIPEAIAASRNGPAQPAAAPLGVATLAEREDICWELAAVYAGQPDEPTPRNPAVRAFMELLARERSLPA